MVRYDTYAYRYYVYADGKCPSLSFSLFLAKDTAVRFFDKIAELAVTRGSDV